MQWPHERSLVKRLKTKPFALLGVNINRHTPKTLKQVMYKEKITWRTFADQGAIAKQWNYPATPMFYLIDHRGIIRRKWAGSPGAKAIDTALAKWIRVAEQSRRKRQ